VSIRPTLFSGPFLDRRAELRDDPGWIEAARADPATRYVLAEGPKQLVSVTGSVDVALLRNGDPLVSLADDRTLTLLGWFRGERTVLVDHSRFGTWVNGARVKERATLRPGDRVRVGTPGVEFTLISTAAAARETAAP